MQQNLDVMERYGYQNRIEGPKNIGDDLTHRLWWKCLWRSVIKSSWGPTVPRGFKDLAVFYLRFSVFHENSCGFSVCWLLWFAEMDEFFGFYLISIAVCWFTVLSKETLLSCARFTCDMYAEFFLLLLDNKQVQKLRSKLTGYMYVTYTLDTNPSTDGQR